MLVSTSETKKPKRRTEVFSLGVSKELQNGREEKDKNRPELKPRSMKKGGGCISATPRRRGSEKRALIVLQ